MGKNPRNVPISQVLRAVHRSVLGCVLQFIGGKPNRWFCAGYGWIYF
jgi:hypothetical protein